MKNKYTLTKKEIIKGRKSFERVLKNGRRFEKGHLKIFVCSGRKRKVGFAVSSRIRKAVIRNRIKRWLREIYRKEKYKLRDNVEILMLVDSFDNKMSYNTLKEDVLNIFRDINENIQQTY